MFFSNFKPSFNSGFGHYQACDHSLPSPIFFLAQLSSGFFSMRRCIQSVIRTSMSTRNAGHSSHRCATTGVFWEQAGFMNEMADRLPHESRAKSNISIAHTQTYRSYLAITICKQLGGKSKLLLIWLAADFWLGCNLIPLKLSDGLRMAGGKRSSNWHAKAANWTTKLLKTKFGFSIST